MPVYTVMLTKEMEFTLVARSKKEAEDAADRLADDEHELANWDCDSPWCASVYEPPAGLGKGISEKDADCGLYEGKILNIVDYQKAKLRSEETEKDKPFVDEHTLPLFPERV